MISVCWSLDQEPYKHYADVIASSSPPGRSSQVDTKDLRLRGIRLAQDDPHQVTPSLN